MITRSKPENAQRQFLPIVRPTATEAVECYPLADEHEVFIVHRNIGRTVPCMGNQCPMCQAMMVREDRIFLPIWSVGAIGVSILDLPASHHETLYDVTMRCRSLRRSKLLIQRMRPADNAPITIRWRALKSDEPERAAFAGLHECLDQIFASNLAFALLSAECQNSEAQISPVLSDRELTRP